MRKFSVLVFLALPLFAQTQPVVRLPPLTPLLTAVAATGTQTGSAVKIATLGAYGTLTVTSASITGSPSACQIVLTAQQSTGTIASAATATQAITVDNTYHAYAITPTQGATADALIATYSCSVYPSAGTITVGFDPIDVVTLAGTQAVSAASLPLPTGAAIETGGNLAAIKADTDKIPSQGQALAAGSTPVVLPALQITALTPPAAITNFANETGGNLAAIKADADKIPAQGQALAAASTPVVLTAAQITTLTPPGAITNFANETGGNLATVASTVAGGKVKVTPDSVALPAHQSTNIDQIGGAALAIGQQLAAASVPVILPAATITTLTPPGAITNFANETGGNLAAIKADTDKIPSQGQALAAGSTPVVLTAAQITTLTPPAAITGFALEAGHLATIDSHIPALGQAVAGSSVPVVLPAAQITTLTPPAAITNFANETGGNLAAIKADTDKIPSQGQALAAGSTPVVLTAAQITTLTPPGAITNFANETGGNLATIAGSVSSAVLQTNVKQMNGAATTMGNGVSGTGVQRVTVASDSTGQVAQTAANVPSVTAMQSAAVANANGTSLVTTGYATCMLQVVSSPSMSGGTTVNFEASADAGTTWSSILAHQLGAAGVLASSTIADGTFRINCAGLSAVRARISAYSAGTVNVNGYESPMAGVPTTVSLAAGTSAIGKVNVLGNAGAIFDGPTGSAVPANAVLQGQTDGTNTVAPYLDPCQRGAKNYKPFSLTATTKLVALSSGKKTYVCAINIVAGAATNVALVEGTKTTTECDTSTAGLAGGATAATGWNFAANGGLALGSGASSVIASGSASLDVCIFVSAANQVSGSLVWVQY